MLNAMYIKKLFATFPDVLDRAASHQVGKVLTLGKHLLLLLVKVVKSPTMQKVVTAVVNETAQVP